MRLWFRLLLFRLAGTFAFLLISLFFLYVIVDLSVNGVRFFSAETAPVEIALYYVRNFAEHLEIFFPLGFLLAAMKVLFDLNLHRELVALQMAGLSKKKLLLPFFLFASLLSAGSYFNSQWLAPDAQEAASSFRLEHAKKKKKMREQVFPLSLEDGTELVYQSFDPQKNRFFDVFWLKAPDDIWHMKYLKADSQLPIGLFVDRLSRNSSSQFEKKESFAEKAFPEIRWDETAPLQRFVPYENRPLATLFFQSRAESADKPCILSHLHYKLALPLLPFLILLSIGPFSLHFARSLPFFLFAACALFAFAALCTLLDGMLILGENRVLLPAVAIWTPFLLSFALSFRPFFKM